MEDLGFDHAWTYDHLVWSGLPDQTWFAEVPTLAAAAMVTQRIGLGTFVSSPNYRHPYTYARDVLTLHDLTQGRFICGVGTRGTLDSILGASLTIRERVDRFAEFLPARPPAPGRPCRCSGAWFTTVDARTLPGDHSVVPLVVAANGPRALRLAAAYGDGWVTTGTEATTWTPGSRAWPPWRRARRGPRGGRSRGGLHPLPVPRRLTEVRARVGRPVCRDVRSRSRTRLHRRHHPGPGGRPLCRRRPRPRGRRCHVALT